MRKLPIYLMYLLVLMTVTVFNSCDKDDDPIEQPAPNPSPNPYPDPEPLPKPPAIGNQVKITVGSTSFVVTLLDNVTANAFKAMLPMTINMGELNGNEKYYNLPSALPTNSTNLGTIQNGDLMLYGSSTFVLFYKSFSTSYSYTRIGRVDNVLGLQDALGSGSVAVKFEIQ